MVQPELPAGLTEFIRARLPTYEAAVLLVFVSRRPERSWSMAELAAELGLSSISAPEVRHYVEHFTRVGLFRMDTAETFRLEAGTPELSEAMAQLRDAYDHRPVTLIRVMRSSANAKLQSFSDSFRLKRD
jgi:hypothetical protein